MIPKIATVKAKNSQKQIESKGMQNSGNKIDLNRFYPESNQNQIESFSPSSPKLSSDLLRKRFQDKQKGGKISEMSKKFEEHFITVPTEIRNEANRYYFERSIFLTVLS